MAAADYRLMTEATGQRIAAALEALSGTGAAAAAARTNLDVYSKGETDNAIAQSPKVASTRIMGNGSTLYQTTPTAIDGYVPICICGYTSIGSYHVIDDLYDFYYDTNSGKILMNFVSAKTSDVGLNVYMLYVKS